jgi:hypothetical protein
VEEPQQGADEGGLAPSHARGDDFLGLFGFLALALGGDGGRFFFLFLVFADDGEDAAVLCVGVGLCYFFGEYIVVLNSMK